MDAVRALSVLRRPHIAQFIDSLDPGGAEDLVLNLSRGLMARGFGVTLIHFGNPWIEGRCRAEGIRQIRLSKMSTYRSKYRLAAFVWVFRRLLAAERVDLLHSHLLGAVFAGAVAARLASCLAVGTLHDAYSLLENKAAPTMLRWSRKAGSRVATVSEQMRETAAATSRLPESAFDVVYNGVDLERFAGRAGHDRHGTVVFLTVARFVRVKRLDVLLRAAAALPGDLDWELRIIGEGPDEAVLRQLADALGIAGRVRFMGFRSDIPEQLAAGDVFVLSSDSEGLSVSIMESMASSLPSVVTEVGGNPELVDDGVSGYLVPANDPGALAKKLCMLAKDAETRRRFGDAARRRAEVFLSLRRTTEEYISLYRSAAVSVRSSVFDQT